MDTQADELLVEYGLKEEKGKEKAVYGPPLHIRRTLDQAYFMTLKDTSKRDRDQVVYRATKTPWFKAGGVTRVMMVDQLWLWILDDYTIITAFPRRWGRNKPDSSGIHKSLRERLATVDTEILSVWHLALLIIDQCSRVFFDRTIPLDLRPEVMDIFAEAIGNVNDRTTRTFEAFWEAMKKMTQERDTWKNCLNIHPAGMLFREAQDIAEELRIMIIIYSQQIDVMKDFHKHLGKFSQNGFHGDASESAGLISPEEMEHVNETIEKMNNRQFEIEEMERAARRTSDDLKEILALKQQQASIIEAKLALTRSDESIRQGQAVMAFTIMTVIFLPLGFFTSFFGMNNSLTGADWMTLGQQCLYMFPLSILFTAIGLAIVFRRLHNPGKPWNSRPYSLSYKGPSQVLPPSPVRDEGRSLLDLQREMGRYRIGVQGLFRRRNASSPEGKQTV
ncbi:hypothetical protein M406DRAFT_358672 [Cryphonectria parasitica EP155]|uniref:Mg2+ transporter protein, CorA-like/Zinc transport protein ZntB n=1 Tax=Cryphonectria parasitica (strain ATCC 38755 / EP155) TaxID=660469 RepID=A0A9P4XSE7_CRYP1|nr:uncharacterized protein M406DRAFT_358672 [Cryphonectria parasitica EP155]KAF3759987.1 hypothetical protein M406DRAFT_358672 [Cryphonectria parasitica EP155]